VELGSEEQQRQTSVSYLVPVLCDNHLFQLWAILGTSALLSAFPIRCQ